MALEHTMFGSLEALPGRVSLSAECQGRIERVAVKIAKGLQYALHGNSYPPEAAFEGTFSEITLDSDNDEPYAPDFTYRALPYPEVGWAFTFYNSVTFFVRKINTLAIAQLSDSDA